MSFLEYYKPYAQRSTHSPHEYHKNIGYAILSSVVERKAVIRFRQGDIYPNIWLVILGTSRITNKSTAIRIGCRLLPQDINCLAYNMTPEAFMSSLGEKGRATWITDEIGNLLKKMQEKKYMADFKEELNLIYDCPQELRIKRQSGEKVLRDVYLTWVGGTTQSRFFSSVDMGDIYSGFIPRFVFVMPDENNLPKWMPRTKRDGKYNNEEIYLQLRVGAIHDFFKEQKEPIELELSEEADAEFRKWEKDFTRKRILEEEHKDVMGIIHGGLADYSLKFAMLNHIDNSAIGTKNIEDYDIEEKGVDEDHLRSEITVDEVKDAIKHIEWLLPQSKQIAMGIIDKTQNYTFQEKVEKVYRYIRRKGRIQHSIIMKNLNLSAKDMEGIVKTLYDRQDIEVEGKQRATYYKIR